MNQLIEAAEKINGLHNLPTCPAGMIATRYGSLMGSVDRIEIELEGKGGHGAIPEKSIDPIVAAFGLHHPKYTLNESCLKTGAALLAAISAKRVGTSL